MNAPRPLKELIAETAHKPGTHLPVFNAVAMDVQKLIREENVQITRIESTLLRDPALAAQVLRMANSSMYAGLASVTTLRQALARVGTQQIMRLVLAAAQVSLYQPHHPLFKQHLSSMWKAAYASAIGCATIAHKSSYAGMAEEAFVAGLLHDVGKLVVLRSIEKLILDKAFTGPLPDAMVGEMIETLHCEFGYELMQRWNFPAVYAVIARDHHNVECDLSNVLMVMVRLMDHDMPENGHRLHCRSEAGARRGRGGQCPAVERGCTGRSRSDAGRQARSQDRSGGVTGRRIRHQRAWLRRMCTIRLSKSQGLAMRSPSSPLLRR